MELDAALQPGAAGEIELRPDQKVVVDAGRQQRSRVRPPVSASRRSEEKAASAVAESERKEIERRVKEQRGRRARRTGTHAAKHLVWKKDMNSWLQHRRRSGDQT